MKKKIIIIIVIIVLIFLALVGYLLYKDFKQEELLQEELRETIALVEQTPIDVDSVNKRLSTTVTSGDYYKVEKSCKEYLSNLFNNIVDLSSTLNDEYLTQILTPENYKEDGPDFVKTTLYISDTKEKLEEGKNSYLENITEEKILSYIQDKSLDDYYVDLYKNLTIGDGILKDEGEIQEFENSIDEVIKILDVSNEVINFLKTNKNSWHIEDDKIIFTSEALGNQYNELLLKLN